MDTKILENFRYLDSLRGWAILGTFCVHLLTLNSIYNATLPYIIERLLFLGQFGVGLFFIVSAYTLTRSIDIRGFDGQASYAFYIRRFFRIAPAYYVFLFIAFFVFPHGVSAFSDSAQTNIVVSNIILHLLFLNGFYSYSVNNILGVEWTIAVEVLFYCLLPFLVVRKLGTLNALFVVAVILMICIPAIRKLFDIEPIYAFWLHFSLLEWASYFIIGVLLYRSDVKSIFRKYRLLLNPKVAGGGCGSLVGIKCVRFLWKRKNNYADIACGYILDFAKQDTANAG